MSKILSVEERVEILEKMNDKIFEIADDEIFNEWFTHALPDEPLEEDFVFIAEDLELFRKVTAVFCKIYKNFIKSA